MNEETLTTSVDVDPVGPSWKLDFRPDPSQVLGTFTGSLNWRSDFVSITTTKADLQLTLKHKVEPVLGHLLNTMIDGVSIPQKWRGLGYESPTLACRQRSYLLCSKLFKAYGFIPESALASKEEGILFRYFNPSNSRRLVLEVYNDLDAAALVVSGKQVLVHEDVKDEVGGEILAAFLQTS